MAAGAAGSDAAVTIRHLLTHTGGLIDYEDFVPDDAATGTRRRRAARCSTTQNRTYFAPGSSYRYSNSGYALLALIVERASGQRFAAFLRERIFEPLGMHATVAFEDGVSTVATRAYGYSASGGSWTRTDQSSTSAVLGDGGIYSSIDDLAKWDAALYDDRLLSKESARARLHAGHADRQPERRLRLRLAHHRRDAVAFGRDARLPQRDPALSATETDGRRAHQSQRSRALFHRARHRAAFLPTRRP